MITLLTISLRILLLLVMKRPCWIINLLNLCKKSVFLEISIPEPKSGIIWAINKNLNENRKLDEGKEQIIRIEEPVTHPTKVVYKEKLAPKAAQQKPQETKKKVVQKKIIESDSESEAEVVVVKKSSVFF